MVAERGGIIRFYRIDNGSPLRCLQGLPSLMSADWSPSNPLIVGAVAGTKCLLWDTSVSRYTHIYQIYRVYCVYQYTVPYNIYTICTI